MTDPSHHVRTTRTYVAPTGPFELLFSMSTVRGRPYWAVEGVIEPLNGGRRVSIPGMQGLAASTEDEAFARACDLIDKWTHTKARR